MAELPSGTVTFLFTDIEGSTRLWEEHPDAMRDALARHDELVREAIEAHGGYVVKTTGDGFHAAFGTADAGVSAAIAAQRALDGAGLAIAGAVAGADGSAHGSGVVARRRLFRFVVEPCGAADGRRARRPGGVLAGDGGSRA